MSIEVFIGVERSRRCAKVRPEQFASEHDPNKKLAAKVAADQAIGEPFLLVLYFV